MFSVHTYSPITSPFSIAVILLLNLNKIYSIFPFAVLIVVANIELFFGLLIMWVNITKAINNKTVVALISSTPQASAFGTSRSGDESHARCSMGPKRSLETFGTCQTSSFGDGGYAKSSVDPKRWLEVVLFGGKNYMSKGDPVATFGKHSHPSDCIFRL